MSGNYSRHKGRRGEYALRDYLRTLGYTVDRVPLSGASQGFKGDLRVSKDGKEIFVEVKVRATGFEILYEKYGMFNPSVFCPGTNRLPCAVGVTITDDFNDLFEDKNRFYKNILDSKYSRKLLSLKSLKQDCEILAIKNDRKPWLFLKYI